MLSGVLDCIMARSQLARLVIPVHFPAYPAIVDSEEAIELRLLESPLVFPAAVVACVAAVEALPAALAAEVAALAAAVAADAAELAALLSAVCSVEER